MLVVSSTSSRSRLTHRLDSDRDRAAHLRPRQLQPQSTMQLLFSFHRLQRERTFPVLYLQNGQILLGGKSPFRGFCYSTSASADSSVKACQSTDWKAYHKTECKALIEATKKNAGAVPDTPIRALGRLVWLKAKDPTGALVSCSHFVH